jgi:hydrogenase maturation protease
MSLRNVRVIGLGNVLMSDDGFGPYVARVLDALYEFPEHVQILDAGTPGLDLTRCLVDADVVVLVETVTAEGCAGDIHQFRLSDVLDEAPMARLARHDPAVQEALLTVAAAGLGPKHALLLGVVPEWTATGVNLSPAVRSAIEPVVALVLSEIARHGVAPLRRREPRAPDTWWERSRSCAAHAVA